MAWDAAQTQMGGNIIHDIKYLCPRVAPWNENISELLNTSGHRDTEYGILDLLFIEFLQCF